MPMPAVPYKYPHAHIAIFAREPELGQVKTRLIPAIGAEAALALYRAMVDRTLQLVRQAQLAPGSVWAASNPSHEYFVSNCNNEEIYLQTGEDLGQRMAACARAVLALPKTEAVLIIGTDCPALQAEYLNTALAALQAGQDLVLGPARDGGYVLIGMRRPLTAPFQGITWGSASVLAQTLAQVAGQGLAVTLLDELWDVDEADDLALLATLKPPLPWP